jgi:hypothetical protein
MDKPEQDTSGDYGYDLAHDDVRAGRRPEPHPRREPAAPAKRTAADLDSDLGYDEAHGF